MGGFYINKTPFGPSRVSGSSSSRLGPSESSFGFIGQFPTSLLMGRLRDDERCRYLLSAHYAAGESHYPILRWSCSSKRPKHSLKLKNTDSLSIRWDVTSKSGRSRRFASREATTESSGAAIKSRGGSSERCVLPRSTRERQWRTLLRSRRRAGLNTAVALQNQSLPHLFSWLMKQTSQSCFMQNITLRLSCLRGG